MSSLTDLVNLCEKELINTRRQEYQKLYIIERRSVKADMPIIDTFGPFTSFGYALNIMKKGYLKHKSIRCVYRISPISSDLIQDNHLLNLNKINMIKFKTQSA